MWQDTKNIYHLFVAFFANVLNGWPSKKLIVVGVTGTDGKTTTSNLIYHILNSSGKKVSMISTLGAVLNGKKYETGLHVTTPSSLKLQEFLKIAKDSGSDYFVLEVTSHALDQNRTWGIPFKVSVLTNVTNEHLDYHKNYKDYLKAKLKLIYNSEAAVINKDDGSFPQIKKDSKRTWINYGLSDNSDVNPNNFELPKIEAEFNKYNYLAAIAACKFLSLTDNEIKKSLKTFELPQGRLDTVYKKKFEVIIDFAHTPNAFLKLLSFARSKSKGRIIHVFGSAGERDREKRPQMGKNSEQFSDLIVLTSEDPRSENPKTIISEIESGIKNKNKIRKVINRKEAIELALQMAKEDDIVLITGKAHEKSMNTGQGEERWDEYEVVREALKEYEKK